MHQLTRFFNLAIILFLTISIGYSQSYSPFTIDQSRSAGDIKFLNLNTEISLPKNQIEPFTLEIPTLENETLSVELVETSVFHPTMQAKYPEIRTYRGIDPKTNAQVAVEQDPSGIYVFVKTPGDYSWQIQTISSGLARMGTSDDLIGDDYIEPPLSCGHDHTEHSDEDISVHTTDKNKTLEARQGPVVKRKFVLALACTGEFGRSNGGTKASVNATYARGLNVMNMIIMSEIAMEFELHPNNDTLIFLDPTTDPYINSNVGTALLGENPPIINARIPIADYDIGHVLTNRCTDVGGVVSGRVCTPTGKARGVTCNGSGDIVRTVSNIMVHEIAHQFAVSHSWNNCNSTPDQRAGFAAFEPGSGTTIMSYQGFCGDDNVSLLPTFEYYHVGSLQQWVDFGRNGGLGESCADQITVSNNEPEINWPYDNGFAIPKSTPFILEADAVDPDGEVLFYNWEQYDLGFALALCDQRETGPLFRSIPPRVDGNVRYFPDQVTVIRQDTTDCEEQLPRFGREMNFRMTARDRNVIGGGTVWEQVTFEVAENAGPFRVTSQTSLADVYVAGSFINVTWDVANTDVAPVNCERVNILLSMDNGLSFPYMLAEDIINDGEEGVTLPIINGTNARIKVEAANNIFYQLSPSRFSIIEPTEPGFTFVPSESSSLFCVPAIKEIEFFTNSILGYDSTLTLNLASTLPNGVTATFSETEIVPGESSILTLDFSNFEVSDSIRLIVEAIGPGVDTAVREIIFDVESNNFSDLQLLSPSNGESGVQGLPTFEFEPTANASEYILQISEEPLFSFATTEILDPDPTGTRLNFLLEPNTLYYWRVIPVNRCSEGFEAPINAFHTFTATCRTYESEEPEIIPSSIATLVETTINIPDPGTVNDLNIPLVDINFNPLNQMQLFVTAPDGTTQRIYNRRCAGSRLVTGFDDQSPVGFSCSPFPNDGELRQPQRPLSIFEGKDLQGEWKLGVNILTGNNSGGSFEKFEIEFCANTVSRAPTLILNEVGVPLGQFQVLDRNYLDATDDDNSSSELMYILMREPTRGHIERYGVRLSMGDTWTQAESQTGGVIYVDDDGMSPGRDEMDIILTDNSGNIIATPTVDFDINDSYVVSTEATQAANIEMIVAPNPTQSYSTVRWAQPSQGGELKVLDSRGALVKVSEIAQGQREYEFDATSLASGIYFLNYRGQEGTKTLRMIVR